SMILGATILFGLAPFRTPPSQGEARASFLFWPLLLGVWAGLAGVFLGNDLFSIYVALELLTFAAVPLVCLDGRAETLSAALRYLLFALLGSLLYLLGTGLLYGTYGTLDLTLLASRLGPEPATLAAMALMTVGLMAKTALFPLHLWLPPAHAGAPSAASAVLSALVVKASFFLIVRIWFDLMPELLHEMAAQLLAAMGAGAILFGSLLALRQRRLKMLIAYSTVAQIGYLFLMFPLAADPGSALAGAAVSASALTGGMLQAISHAFAKAAMFMAAGLIAEAAGHDRIADLGGIGKALPMAVAGFALGGLSLVGVPPSGGFWAKWLLLTAAIDTGQWWWAMAMLAGGLLAAGYVFRALAPALARAGAPATPFAPVSRFREAIVLGLALCSLLLGLMAFAPLDVMRIGQPGTPVASGGVAR
ncbi:MAG: proton-conducting transporter membrane subunit, partial [Phycisphaerales bacterium]